MDGRQFRKFFPDKESASAWLKDRSQSSHAQWNALSLSERCELLWLSEQMKLHELTAKSLIAKPRANPPELSEQIRRYIGVKEDAGRSVLYLRKLASNLNKYSQFIAADSSGSISVLLGRYTNLETRATMLTSLSGFFSFGVRNGWYQSNPCAGLERPTIRRPEPAILTPEQASELVLAVRRIDPGLQRWVALAMFCGVRPCELRRMADSDVRADNLVVPGPASKTNRRRYQPIHADVRRMASVGGVRPRNLRKRLGRVKAALSFKLAKNCLRHSAASYLTALHSDAAKVALWLGHSVQVLFSHYYNAVPKEEAERFFRAALDE